MIYDKRPGIPWYIHFVLIFLRLRFSTDVGQPPEKSVTICYKTFMGKMYVLSEITADTDLA